MLQTILPHVVSENGMDQATLSALLEVLDGRLEVEERWREERCHQPRHIAWLCPSAMVCDMAPEGVWKYILQGCGSSLFYSLDHSAQSGAQHRREADGNPSSSDQASKTRGTQHGIAS
ncbi:UNVERIFIED_CONTAM: hypothetical protein FKN15_038072 [Acipenser sinensis]